MADTLFRTKQEPVEEKLPEGKTPVTTPIESSVEVPYSTYEDQQGHPFTVDYFHLGEYWDDPQGGYVEEVDTIERYLENQINQGVIDDSQPAIRAKIKEMLKINNLKEEDRTVVKMGVLASYARFMSEKDSLRGSLRKYGYHSN